MTKTDNNATHQSQENGKKYYFRSKSKINREEVIDYGISEID